MSSDVVSKLSDLFLPYASRRLRALNEQGRRLVHYTTAENALRIIQSRTVWMRNARVMSDFSEIQHGMEQLRNYFHADNKVARERFYDALHQCHENVGKDAIAQFDQWWSDIQFSTYITCFSEHHTHEDDIGRLSMWRAFGSGLPRVAMVFNMPADGSANGLNVVLSPVAYMTPEQLAEYMGEVTQNIAGNTAFLKSVTRDACLQIVYWTLVNAVISLKHPGFHEEEEWRLIYSPRQRPSKYVLSSTETIRGIPQIVQKIPLKNTPEADINGVELAQLVSRVIVGPSDHSYTIYESIAQELATAGVADAHNKVVISSIPIRE